MKPVVVKVAYRVGETPDERALRSLAIEHARSLGYRFTRNPAVRDERTERTLDPRYQLAVFTVYPVGHGPGEVRSWRVEMRVSIGIDAASEEEAEELALDEVQIGGYDFEVTHVSEVGDREMAS